MDVFDALYELAKLHGRTVRIEFPLPVGAVYSPHAFREALMLAVNEECVTTLEDERKLSANE